MKLYELNQNDRESLFLDIKTNRGRRLQKLIHGRAKKLSSKEDAMPAGSGDECNYDSTVSNDDDDAMASMP